MTKTRISAARMVAVPENLPFVGEPIEIVKPVKRAGRTLRARLSRMMPEDSGVSIGVDSIRQAGNGFTIFRVTGVSADGQPELTATRVVLPPSLQAKLGDTELQSEILEYIAKIRASLGKKEDYKLHLDKEAPDYLTLAYSISGKPTQYLSIHPERVAAGVDAFEDAGEYEAFSRAVAQQNFNNVAYKKWRERHKELFVDDVITRELCRAYGDPDEFAAYETAHAQVAALHAQRKGVPADLMAAIAEVAVPTPESTTTDELPELAIPLSVLPEAASEEDLVVEEVAAELQEVGLSAELPAVSRSEVAEAVSLSDLQAALGEAADRLTRAQVDYDYYAGPLGELVCKINGVQFADIESEYVAARDAYADLAHQARLTTLDSTLGKGVAALQAHALPFPRISSFVDQGDSRDYLPHMTAARLFKNDHRERLVAWLDRFETEIPARSVAAELIMTAPLSGIVKTGLLGLPVMHTTSLHMSPAAVARLATLLGIDTPDLAASRAALQTARLKAPAGGPLSTQELLRQALSAREIESVLAGERGPAASPYVDGYDREYAELVSSYVDALSATISLDSIANESPTMEELLATSEVSPSVAETAQIAETLDEAPSSTVETFLALQEAKERPDNLQILGVVSDIAMLEGGALAQRARALLARWNETQAWRDHDAYTVTLHDNESLFAALQRIVRGHPDYFATVPGAAVWQKAHRILSDLHERHGLDSLSDDQMEWLRLGAAGDLVCYTSDGQLYYCRMS